MEHVLSIYNSKTKELLYKNQEELDPRTMFENWFFSSECDQSLKDLKKFGIFYYSISEDFNDRMSGKIVFKKGNKGKLNLTFYEIDLFFQRLCSCCGETVSVGCLETITANIDGKLTYVASDYEDEDYNENLIIVPFNPYEFNFVGYNPCIPDIFITEENE